MINPEEVVSQPSKTFSIREEIVFSILTSVTSLGPTLISRRGRINFISFSIFTPRGATING